MNGDPTREIIDRLRATPDMKQKAVIAGLAHAPVTEDGIDKACDNCIYYLPHTNWCDLPELNIPVDPEWYCILWRV